MKNLVQIICGCAAAETIEECARIPESLGATVIVIHAIWPRIDHPTGEKLIYSDSENWLGPLDQLDNVENIAKNKGWHFIQMHDYAYNGKQYNLALDYIKSRKIPCDAIWFVDSDECIDPRDTDTLLKEIELFRSHGIESVRFHKRKEILPGYREFTYDVTGGNYGIVFGDLLSVQRKTHFDGNFFFERQAPYAITSVPLLHLHHFRKNAARRITNGIWYGAGLEVEISKLPHLYSSSYTNFLIEKYPEFHIEDANKPTSYLGSALFEKQ